MPRTVRIATGPTWSIPAPSRPDLRAFPGRPDALRHHGQARQERQDAALGRHLERRRDRRYLGLCIEPEETMKVRLAALAAAILLAAAATTAARAADEPLKVCLDEDRPPFSAHHRGKPDTGFDVALGAGYRGSARPAAEDPVVRKQARRRFEPAAGSQCAALRRPLLAGRRLRVHQGFAGRARR